MTLVLPGTQVEARGLAWEVVQTEPAGDQQRYRLRCLQGDLLGMEVDLLHPFEAIQPITADFDPRRAGRLRQWQLFHDAFLLEQSLGPSALLAVQPGRLDIAPYQLVPVMRALRMSRPRLLLADGVGLGKTIEAGLLMAELIARRRAHRILIVSPAGPLLEQWQREMRERFGLRFETIRSAGELQERRRELVLGANPFDHVSYCLTSVDFAKQEKVLQELERTVWDLVIIDEAHHCVRLGSSGDWEDSRRRRLAEVLASRCDGLLLLTATPHDGFDPHFASLVELLDPSLVDGRGGLRAERYRQHVVRRLKNHIKDPETGEPLFRTRQVTPRAVMFNAAEQPEFTAFQQALLAAVAPRIRQAVRQRRFGEVLAFVSLLKRSVSTVAACRNTLAVIRDRYREIVSSGISDAETRKQRLRSLREYQQRLERYGSLSFEEEQDRAALEAEDMAADLAETGLDNIAGRIEDLLRTQRRERDRGRRIANTGEALDGLVEMAEAALDEDPKLRLALAELQAIRQASPGANVLIYTEYTDSQDALVAFLESAVSQGDLDGAVLAVSGRPEHAQERSTITERFSHQDGLILVSTDATAEGLNLHERCHHLIHLELPYNPNRLEQRNGRIDRYGQRSDPDVRYLYLAGTFEERLLLRLVAKYERQRARLTFVPNTLGGITTEDAQTVRLLEGLGDEEETLFATPGREILQLDDAAEEDTGSAAYRDLLAEVERAMAGYEKAAKTSSWLGEVGLNAEARLLAEAEQARSEGERLGAVELMDFVCQALESDGGTITPAERSSVSGTDVVLRLPTTWTHGLRDIPGYDAEQRALRLTSDAKRCRDEAGRDLGYLGRAHPIVRRALDRVRNLRFGETDACLDRRISAIGLDIPAPALLCTFLGVLESDRGHELERVLALRIDATGSFAVLAEPETWLQMVTAGEPIRTADLWEQHFSSWGEEARQQAKQAVAEAFAAIAEPASKEHTQQLQRELRNLEDWLRSRADTICGAVQQAQMDLLGGTMFGGSGGLASWQVSDDPAERLAGYATDGRNPPAQRREADGVLRLLRDRKKELEQRAQLRTLEPQPLGLLMLVPTALIREGGQG
jgi:ERCC4-related helicase